MNGIPKSLLRGSLCLGLLLTLITSSRAQTLGEVLNATNLTWTASSWTVQTNIAHDAIASARLGGGNSVPAEAWLQTTVTGMTAVTFWWKVSCCAEFGSTYLDFSIGGVPQGRIAGQIDWQQRSFWVPEGTQTLRWRYTASCSSSAATNAGWVDEVGFTEPVPPAIVQGPTNQTVATADAVVLQAQAAGTEPWWWQWRLNGSDLPGATNAWLTISNAQPANAGDYTVVLTTPLGAVTSQVATLTVVPSPPLFTLQPLSQSNILGSKVTFSAAAKGLEPLLWQWYFNQQPVPDATNSTLVITNLQVTDAGEYTVVVRNELEAVTSQPATLSVILAPLWTKQPASQAAPAGATVSFSASVQGSGTLGWQWYFEDQALPGATSPVLRMTNVGVGKYGNYWVAVTNAYGSATSAAATLSYSPVVAWGSGEALTNVPPAATNVVALTGGDNHLLALRADGTVVAWGNGSSGQTVVPPEATNVASIAAGSTHSLGLRADGSVLLWGHLLGSYNNSTVPAELTNVVALALGPGAWHALALKADGTVQDWGLNSYGLTDVPPEATNVVAVAAGARHSVALRADGSVVVWGDNAYGETNMPPTVTNVVAIATGWHHTLALRADGTVVGWGGTGMHNYGQTRIPAEAVNVVAIACGGEHSLALCANGKLLAWGDNAYGRVRVPAWASNVVAIAGTSYDSLALLGDGPPRIHTQPVSRRATPGETARLVASAVGALPLSYQWLKEGAPLPGATGAWLFLTNVQAEAAAGYSLVASNALGMVTSRVAAVTLSPAAPRLAGLPATMVAPSNGVAWLTVEAVGSPPLSYQWSFGGTNLLTAERVSGADSATLVIDRVGTADLGGYTVVVTNVYGAVTSGVVMLRFATVPESVGQAVDALDRTWTLPSPINWFWQTGTTHDGQDAVQSPRLADNGLAAFSTTNWGPSAVSFWWKVSSQTNGDYLKFFVYSAEQARLSGEVDWQWRSFLVPYGLQTLIWQYVKNASVAGGQDCGWVDQVSFGPVVPPTLTKPPLGGAVVAGSNYTFSASASGTEPFTYQWRRYGTNWPGGNGAALTLSKVQVAQAGAYSVVVSNLAGVVTSAEAVLQVIPGLMRFEPQSVVWADGRLRFTASGPAGARWCLQSSTNLLDWEDSLTLTNAAGSLEFADPATSSALRFYRLRFAP